MKTRIAVASLILVLLAAGLSIYLYSRTSNTLIAEAANHLSFLSGSFIHLPSWITFVLPDVLWMAALSLTILLVWNFRIDRQSLSWYSIAWFGGMAMEFFQKLHWIGGTFDPQDIIGMSLGWLIPLTCIGLKKYIWKTN